MRTRRWARERITRRTVRAAIRMLRTHFLPRRQEGSAWVLERVERARRPAPGASAAGAPAAVSPAAANPTLGGANVQADDKGAMMERRLAAAHPRCAVHHPAGAGPNGEKAGRIRVLLHSTDWVNHLLFSPTDPQLLMYCTRACGRRWTASG